MYDAVADLPLAVEDVALGLRERDTSSGFTRATTTVVLRGEGREGRGEDVAYEREAHHALQETSLDLAGEYTLDSFSDRLEGVDLWPSPPERESDPHYRRWGFESAALDLALEQADTDIGAVLDRSYDPVRFVVSTRLEPLDGGDGGEADDETDEATGDETGDETVEASPADAEAGEYPPPASDPIDRWLAIDPDLEFKLDPTPAWDDALVVHLADTGAVRTLDLKGLYDDAAVATPADPALYRRILEGFPEALVEDTKVTDETGPLVEKHRDRLSWDYPITGVESVEALPFEPEWLNCKPSRFSTVESLFDFLAYCEERGISLYGGGQFELGVGRDQIQTIASLFYPDGPNDVAPRGYNDPEPREGLPSSPLAPPGDPVGFGGNWSV